ncbi:hypothetical protein SAMN04515674_10374 [Pseudarcicella hirudinis]|uniref:Uncharacterized protein n=1 Tax=Pseudarcicella hirudinis TaxID=1079859 RepID=A0A1I5QA49_9BACT|nr:hypothetical protein SAMN04515674_10374 [Pseudarcicella hirudinis]
MLGVENVLLFLRETSHANIAIHEKKSNVTQSFSITGELF